MAALGPVVETHCLEADPVVVVVDGAAKAQRDLDAPRGHPEAVAAAAAAENKSMVAFSDERLGCRAVEGAGSKLGQTFGCAWNQ